jgi:hypothetical protein
MIHRGEIVERAIRNSGIPLTTIAKKLGKTRQWIYYVFENPNVPLDLIIEIGKIIFYDFSRDIPQIIVNSYLKDQSPETNFENNQNSDFWKEKYFNLLEEHLDLLKKFSELKK